LPNRIQSLNGRDGPLQSNIKYFKKCLLKFKYLFILIFIPRLLMMKADFL